MRSDTPTLTAMPPKARKLTPKEYKSFKKISYGVIVCPDCDSSNVVRHGYSGAKVRFRCRNENCKTQTFTGDKKEALSPAERKARSRAKQRREEEALSDPNSGYQDITGSLDSKQISVYRIIGG